MKKSLRFLNSFRVKPVAPYSYPLTVHKPAGWSLLTPYEIYEDGILWTATRMDSGQMLGLKLTSLGTIDKPEIHCVVFSEKKMDPKAKLGLIETLTWMLGAREDINGFYALGRRDPLVRALVKDLYGMRDTNRPDLFPMLTLALTLQMAPMKRSYQMMDLLIKKYGSKIVFDKKKIQYWPSPETIAKASVKELEEKCKLGYRAKHLKSIAQSLCKGFPTYIELSRMPPNEAKVKLMELGGIGEYSADIVSPHPGFPLDVWSVKIFSLLLFNKQPEKPRESIPMLKEKAEERWGEWRGYVFTYVLNDLENLSARFNANLRSL